MWNWCGSLNTRPTFISGVIPRAAVLRGFALGRSGLGRFIVGLDCPLFRAGRMGAGLKHQGDPACQKDHDDDSQE